MKWSEMFRGACPERSRRAQHDNYKSFSRLSISQRDGAENFIQAALFAMQFADRPMLLNRELTERQRQIFSRAISLRMDSNRQWRFIDDGRFLHARQTVDLRFHRGRAPIKCAIT